MFANKMRGIEMEDIECYVVFDEHNNKVSIGFVKEALIYEAVKRYVGVSHAHIPIIWGTMEELGWRCVKGTFRAEEK